MAAVSERPSENTAYAALGGEAPLRHIVDRFYDLLDTEPAFAPLRNLHAADLTPMRESLTGFLRGWLGGPRDWFAAAGSRCIMSIHSPYAIDDALAGQWSEAMRRAIEDTPLANRDLGNAMSQALAQMATGMIRRS